MKRKIINVINLIRSYIKNIGLNEGDVYIDIIGGRFEGNMTTTVLIIDKKETKWWIGEAVSPHYSDINKAVSLTTSDRAKFPVCHAWASCEGKPYQYHGIYNKKTKILNNITRSV